MLRVGPSPRHLGLPSHPALDPPCSGCPQGRLQLEPLGSRLNQSQQQPRSPHCQPAERDVQPEVQLRQRTGHHVPMAPHEQGRPRASQPILLPADPESPGGGQIFGQPDFWPQRKLEQGPGAAQDSLETPMGGAEGKVSLEERLHPTSGRSRERQREGRER